MSRTSDQLKKECEENDLPTATAVEEIKPLYNDDDIEYNNYLEIHKTKLNEIAKAVKWILRTQLKRNKTGVNIEYKTGISLKELHDDYQCIYFYERFVNGLYARHKKIWFTKEELDSIDEVVLSFKQTICAEPTLVLYAGIYRWNTYRIIFIHLCCCFFPNALLRYYKRE